VKENEEEHPGRKAVGERFQEETKYTPQSIGGHSLDWEHMPERYKSYPESIRRIALPKPQIDGQASVWEVLSRRRSVRNYSTDRTMPLGVFSTLIWATQGITAAVGDHELRSAPSAGALYPIETYLLVRAVEGLDQGFYHFRPHSFDLELTKSGDFAHDLAKAALGQGMVFTLRLCLYGRPLSSEADGNTGRGRIAIFIWMQAIAQNLYACWHGCRSGVCGIGAFSTTM
jgi:SagB-type dehydrogenase family enzyme